jgi:hypothetical protein
MSIRSKLAGLVAGTADIAGRAAAATARRTVAVVKHPTTRWAARTTVKGVLVGGSTAAGAALFGPVGAAIAAGIAGTAVASTGGGQPPAQA